eukprot:9207243-Alexandrium_andersonii.AAC.1
MRGEALRWASDDLRGDRDIVFQAPPVGFGCGPSGCSLFPLPLPPPLMLPPLPPPCVRSPFWCAVPVLVRRLTHCVEHASCLVGAATRRPRMDI